MNPCEQCIVNPMCKKSCTLLVDYLQEKLIHTKNPVTPYDTYEIFAKAIRKGTMTLGENDTALYWAKEIAGTDDELKKRINI